MVNRENVVAEVEIVPSHEYGTMRFYDMLIRDEIRQRFLETSVLAFHFDMPGEGDQFKLRAIFSSEDMSIEKEMILVKKYSRVGEYLSVWTSSEDLRVGAYATFHVNSNFIIDVFYLLVS